MHKKTVATPRFVFGSDLTFLALGIVFRNEPMAIVVTKIFDDGGRLHKNQRLCAIRPINHDDW